MTLEKFVGYIGEREKAKGDAGGVYRCARCGEDLTAKAKKLHRGRWWCWNCPSEAA